MPRRTGLSRLHCHAGRLRGNAREQTEQLLRCVAEKLCALNNYDWLGQGIYFWEHGVTRARQFAEEKRERGELKDPVVVGAYLQLGRCLDLTDVWATRLVHALR